LDVYCSKGTYIRSLAEDIGHDLGCGGTVKELRRLEAGQFKIEQATTIEQLKAMDQQSLNQCLLNVDKPLEGLPAVQLSEDQASCIKQGQCIVLASINSGIMQSTEPDTVRMYKETLFLGLGELSLDGKLTPKRMFNL